MRRHDASSTDSASLPTRRAFVRTGLAHNRTAAFQANASVNDAQRSGEQSLCRRLMRIEKIGMERRDFGVGRKAPWSS